MTSPILRTLEPKESSILQEIRDTNEQNLTQYFTLTGKRLKVTSPTGSTFEVLNSKLKSSFQKTDIYNYVLSLPLTSTSEVSGSVTAPPSLTGAGKPSTETPESEKGSTPEAPVDASAKASTKAKIEPKKARILKICAGVGLVATIIAVALLILFNVHLAIVASVAGAGFGTSLTASLLRNKVLKSQPAIASAV